MQELKISISIEEDKNSTDEISIDEILKQFDELPTKECLQNRKIITESFLQFKSEWQLILGLQDAVFIKVMEEFGLYDFYNTNNYIEKECIEMINKLPLLTTKLLLSDDILKNHLYLFQQQYYDRYHNNEKAFYITMWILDVMKFSISRYKPYFSKIIDDQSKAKEHFLNRFCFDDIKQARKYVIAAWTKYYQSEQKDIFFHTLPTSPILHFTNQAINALAAGRTIKTNRNTKMGYQKEKRTSGALQAKIKQMS